MRGDHQNTIHFMGGSVEYHGVGTKILRTPQEKKIMTVPLEKTLVTRGGRNSLLVAGSRTDYKGVSKKGFCCEALK